MQIWIFITIAKENEQQVSIPMQQPLWGFGLMHENNGIFVTN